MGRDRHRNDQHQGGPLTDDLDSLFAAPPTEFIAERKRIVAALKGAGRKDDAKAVEKIPRPSVAVWTVNQIARREPALVRRLGVITERLQGAAGPEYGAAAAEHRQVLGELRDKASEVLTGAGHDAGPHIVQKVIANLRAAAGAAETRATLEQGRLQRDVEEQDAAGLFGAALAAGAAQAPREKAAAPKIDERARAREIAAAEREIEKLRKAEAAARKDVDRAERAVAAAQESLAAAESKLAEERAAAETAAQALAEAEAELARLV